MPGTPGTPAPQIDTETETRTEREPGYLVVVWDDPINLMSYVVHVFRKVFGWDREKAERHMMEVHEKEKSVLVREDFEKAEAHVHALQSYSLNATVERES